MPVSDLTQGLVSFYQFETGPPFIDEANGHNFANGGGFSMGRIAGVIGDAGTTSGDAYGVTSSFAANLATGFTIAGWCNLQNTNGFGCVLSRSDGAISSGMEFTLAIGTATTRLIICDGASDNVDFTGPSLTQFVWGFVVAVFDPTAQKAKLSLDNGAFTEAAWTHSINQNNQPMTLGAWNPGDSSFNFFGYIDQLGLWSRALAADDLTFLYNGGAGVTYADIQGTHPNNPGFSFSNSAGSLFGFKHKRKFF